MFCASVAQTCASTHPVNMTTKLQAPVPSEIFAPKGAQEMRIVWADGHVGIYPHDILRGYCPCAHCQGHQGPIRYVSGANLTLMDIQEVGLYAIRLSWGDGHQTGIYSFRYLRDLCVCTACGPVHERILHR